MDDNTTRRRRRWMWVAACATACVLLVVVGATLYFAVGRKIWTDDRDIRRPDSQAKIRQVLWDPPEALDESFNTPDQEYEPSAAADGGELYFVRGLPGKGADIHVSYRSKEGWSKPAPVAGINTKHDELGPRLTPDGRFLMFYSDRPGGQGQYDIWAAERAQEGWGKPFNLGPNVNSKWNEYGPAMDPQGKRLYIATNRKAAARRAEKEVWRATIRQGEIGDYDLFVAEVVPPRFVPSPPSLETDQTQPAAPTTAPASARAPLAFKQAKELQGINTLYHEGACCISPYGDFLYFASDRPGGLGGFDLYRCRLQPGRCGEAENLGPEINTPDNEADPQLAMGGFQIYFSSDRSGTQGGYDLWMSESHEVYAIRARRPLPLLGWSWWVLLIALAALIPLLLWLRAAEYKHLSLLQKCVVISLLFHIGLTILLGLWKMSQEFLEYIAREGGMTTAVNLELAREVEVKMQVRHQITDLPVADRSLTDLGRAKPTPLLKAPPARAEVAVPKARIEPVPRAQQPEAPRMLPPVVTDRVSLPPPPILADAPSVRMEPQSAIVQAEAKPQPTAAQAAPTEMRPTEAVPPRPAEQMVTVAAAPARLEAESLVRPVTAKRPVLPVTAERRPTVQVPPQPALEPAPADLAAVPVRAAQPEEPTVAAGAATAAKRQAAPPRRVEQDVVLAAAPARPQTESLLPAARARRPVLPVTQNIRAEVHVPPQPALEPAPTEVVASPIRAAQPEEPTVGTTAVPSAKRPAAPPRRTGQDVVVAAAPARPAAESLVKTAATTRPAPRVTRAVRVEARVPPQVALSAAPAEVAASPVRATQPEEPAVAAGTVASAKRDIAPPRWTGQAVTVAAAPTRAAPESLVRPAAGKPLPAPAQAVRAPARVPPQPALKAAPAEIAAGPVRVAQPEGPGAVVGAVKSAKRVTASPRARPGAPEVGVPSAQVIPESRVVAMSVTPHARPDAPQVPVSIPPVQQGPQIQLPATSQQPGVRAEEHPVRAEPQPAAALKPRLLSAGTGRRLTGPVVPGHRPTSAEQAKESLANQVIANAPTRRAPGGAEDRVTPQALPIPLSGSLGPGRLTAPPSWFQRSFEQRQRIIERMGGTKETEEHVARALVYLAANQERDGRWTAVHGRRRGADRRQRSDMALTGLASLCFLAADHTPTKAGPYRQVITRALDYMLAEQRPDGDLRGPGDMYSQAIATLAIAEAAVLTGDPGLRRAAIKGAEFIVRAQNPQAGGWRYHPRTDSDTSVFGWQIMALHSVEQLGVKIPERCRRGCQRWLARVSRSRHKMIAGYQDPSPRPAMTAEAVFSHILLRGRLSEAEMKEASDYLLKYPPQKNDQNFYYWYYASLSLMQMQNEAWDKWNVMMRDLLMKLQRRGGDLDGSWDPDRSRYARRPGAGRIYSTALSTLTLEVYYRYLPMYGRPMDRTKK